jgi:hypothetical protein
MKSTESVRREIHINLDEILGLMNIAIRRASAFARLALYDLEERGSRDFNLSAKMLYQFWPEKISHDQRSATRAEFRAWVTGNCLRELDLFYNIFLDRIWFAIEVAERHQKNENNSFQFDTKFEKDSNVANKHKKICEKLGIDSRFESLNSLSLARNALSHRSGAVKRPNDCNNVARDELKMTWLALDTILSRGGLEMLFEGEILDTAKLPGEGEVAVMIRVSERHLHVKAGERLILSEAQLAELCLYYKILSDSVAQGLAGLITQKGIAGPTAQTSDT